MSRWWIAIALMGCGAPSSLLGGQEGEPLAPPPDFAPAPNDDDFTADPGSEPEPPPDSDGDGLPDCEIGGHCKGDGWCAEYSVATVPDLEAVCPDSFGEGPCPIDGLEDFCSLGLDPCSRVVVYDADLVCEDLAAGE